jgi:hypothetical protein
VIDTRIQLTAEDVALTNANLDLLAEFVQECLELPDDAELFPEGASVVFLPPPNSADPEHVAANMRIARKQAAQGQRVWIWTIGSGRAMTLQEYEARSATGSVHR